MGFDFDVINFKIVLLCFCYFVNFQLFHKIKKLSYTLLLIAWQKIEVCARQSLLLPNCILCCIVLTDTLPQIKIYLKSLLESDAWKRHLETQTFYILLRWVFVVERQGWLVVKYTGCSARFCPPQKNNYYFPAFLSAYT